MVNDQELKRTSRFYSWLGVQSLSDELKNLVRVRLVVNFPRIFAFNFLIITLTLFYLDTLSPTEVGFVWGAYFTVLALLDYASGTLGDQIGYKRVLLGGYVTKVLAMPFLLLGASFIHYLVFMILMAVGESQESGALEAWFDNQYRPRAEAEDPERKIYTQFTARSGPLYNIMTVTGFSLGGVIATAISRQAVFLIFAVVTVLELLLIQKIMWVTHTDRSEENARQYFGRVRESFSVFLNSRVIFFYFLGIAAIWAANESVWHTFLSVRIYFEYGGSDTGAGLIRALVFASATLWQFLVIKFIDRFKRPHLWVFLSTVISNASFFAMVLTYYQIVPPMAGALVPIIGLLLIYQIPVAWETLQFTLQQRINLDLIPDKHRNALYSLLPTLARLFGVPFVSITGFITGVGGFFGSFYWLIAISFIGSILLGTGLLLGADSASAEISKTAQASEEASVSESAEQPG